MKNNNMLQVLSFSFLLFLTLNTSAAAEKHPGEAIFNTMKCGTCHGTEAKQRGPSLSTIADTYTDVDQMLLFFNGKMESIVEPARAKTMRPRLRKIMKLSDTKKKDLASYLMSFKGAQ